jgi:hypothetical protein
MAHHNLNYEKFADLMMRASRNDNEDQTNITKIYDKKIRGVLAKGGTNDQTYKVYTRIQSNYSLPNSLCNYIPV